MNTALIWEKVKEFDLGLDLSFLKNRINVTADFYNRLSDGQIMSRSVPLETGEKTSTFNVGSVQNRGIELGLQFNIINKKDFSWSANVNFARNWNKIKEYKPGCGRGIGVALYNHGGAFTGNGEQAIIKGHARLTKTGDKVEIFVGSTWP